MKMTKTDYKRLNELVITTIQNNKIMPRSEYPGMSLTRYCWDIFHSTMDRLQYYNQVADYLFTCRLSDKYNDDHINTALKKIIKEYQA